MPPEGLWLDAEGCGLGEVAAADLPNAAPGIESKSAANVGSIFPLTMKTTPRHTLPDILKKLRGRIA